jgi:hypothetical protein
MNVKKECYANGVCRIDQNGQVNWSGPPEEVAKMQGAQEGRKQALAEVDKAYAEAPKRSESEPIRLVLIGPTADAPDLAALSSAYRAMMEAALRGDPRIELVPYDRVKLLAEASSGNSMRSSSFHPQEVRAKVDSELTHRLRDGNSDVDVVLVAHLVPKEVTGFVQGGGGAGVAQVVNVEFQASMSSVYELSEIQFAEVGNSTDRLAVAGLDKKGKASSGELKGKRNPENDRGAIQHYGTWVKNALREKIAPTLPAIAAVQEIRAKNRERAMQDAPAWFRRVAGH